MENWQIAEYWAKPLFGGILLGLGASFLWWTKGRILGVSGVYGGLWRPKPHEWAWRLSVISGLLSVGFVLGLVADPSVFGAPNDHSYSAISLAGFLVGIGSRLANGCTSGHGVCGLSRFSGRSIAATITFMATGIITATALSWFGGAP